MKKASNLERVRELLTANSSSTVAYLGTSPEMIAHLLKKGEILSSAIDRGSNQRAPLSVAPTRRLISKIFKANNLSEHDLVNMDAYDERELGSFFARSAAMDHRINAIFGEPLGTYVDAGDMLALEPVPDFKGDLRSIFRENSAEELFDWLRAVMSEEQVRELMHELYIDRFGVAVGVRRSIEKKIKEPSLPEVRFLVDEGLQLKPGATVKLQDISSIHPLGKADRNYIADLLAMPGIKAQP